MKMLLVAASLALAIAPAFAQPARKGVTANVDLTPGVIDPARLLEVRCRLGLVNPKACIARQTSPRQPGASTRPSQPGGAARP